MELSVIIVTYRSGRTLPATLAALAASAVRPSQLVVVENGGDSDIRALVTRAWPGADVIVNPANLGFAAAVNQGLGHARGDLLLLLNPDAEPEPAALGELARILQGVPDAGIAAPRLLEPDGRPVLSCYPFLSLWTVAWRHLQVHRLLPDVVLGRYRRVTLGPRTTPVAVEWAQGACLLVDREVLDQVGPLDERFFLYCEEVDLCRRAALRGKRTYYVPTARVRHAEGSSSGQVVPLKLASHYFSKVLYFSKHLGPTQTVLLRGLLLLDLALRSAYRAAGVLVGRPLDARQRLASYAAIMRALATAGPVEIEARWRALGATVNRPPVGVAA